MNDKIRVGILGGGGILCAHAPGFVHEAGRCKVVAVAEPDVAQHDRIRQLLKDETVAICGDYHELLARRDVDAVDILLPHDLHMPAAIAAARAKKHILCEKVMARNVHECQQMIAAANANGVTLTVSHDRRYDPDWSALKGVVDSGVLGEILFWKLEHNQDVALPESSWIRSRSRIGGGAIMSCLTHQIDALRWYGGEVARVSCMTKISPARMEGECIGAILASMKSGALATLAINWFTRSSWGANGLWYELVHVTGTAGDAYFMTGKGTWLKRRDGDDDFVRVEGENTHSGHTNCISQWLRMLRGEPSRVLTDASDAVKTVEVAEAAYQAEKTGQAVTLPITPVPFE